MPRWACTLYVETFRAAPLILLMYFALFALPKIGIEFVTPYWAVVIGLVAYNSAVFAEIFPFDGARCVRLADRVVALLHP